MQIRAHLSVSTDGFVTTPDGWPAQLAGPEFVPGQSHGIREHALPGGSVEIVYTVDGRR